MPRNTQPSSQKQAKQNTLRYVSCHLCLNPTSQFAQCSINRCKNFYCFQCIVEKFNKDFKPGDYVKEYWVCYSCGGSCKCLFCTGIDRNRKRRKPKNEKHQITESVSAKSQDKNPEKQKEQLHSPAQIPSHSQIQGFKKQATEKRKIYETRRLPIKRNVAFKYKTKRRPRGKNNIDVRSLLQNIKPEDKIFKIKKNDIMKDYSDQQNEEQPLERSSERQSELSQSEEERIPKDQQKIKKRGYRQLKKLTEGRTIEQKYEKESSEKQSSLGYLQKKEKSNKGQSNSNKTRPIRKTIKTQPLPKSSTITNIESKRQSANQKQPTKLPGQTIMSESNSQSQGSQKIQQEAIDKRYIDRRMGSRSRNKGGRRRKIFSMKKELDSDDQKHDIQDSEHKLKRGRVRIKRSDRQDSYQRQTKSISTRQVKQLPGFAQGSVDGPKRRSQRNLPQNQQKNEQKIIVQELKEGSSDQDNSIRQQSQSAMGHESENKKQSQDSDMNSVNGQRMVEDQDEQEQEQKNANQKIKRNSMVKKRYQDQLEKNIKYQVISSSSQDQEQPQNNQQNSEPQEQHDDPNQPQNTNPDPKQQLQNPQINNKQNIQTQIQKAKESNSPQKTSNFTPHVYRKPTHHKKNIAHLSQTAHAATHSNSIANKWKQIQDHHLLDIKNIQKLGIQALFARQNLSKQMNTLMKRRNQLLQKIKNQSQLKEVIDVSRN